MDLAALNPIKACDVPADVTIRHPGYKTPLQSDEGEVLAVTVYGMQSTVARNAGAQAARDRTETSTEDEQAEIGAKYLAALTVGWSDFLELNGEPLPFSFENAVKLYMQEDWLARQVYVFANNLVNYYPKT